MEKKEKSLTAKEKIFVDEYLKCFNGAQAARNAKYSKNSIYAIAYENLRKPHIRAEIDKRMSEIHMSSAEVLARLSDHARASHRPFVKVTDDGFVYFDFSNPEAIDHMHLVKKIETKRSRRVVGKVNKDEDPEEWEDEWVKVELHDPQSALQMLGKYHKLFVDRKEHSGPNGGPIPIGAPAFDMRKMKEYLTDGDLDILQKAAEVIERAQLAYDLAIQKGD
jgi:phage terminase small subunit